MPDEYGVTVDDTLDAEAGEILEVLRHRQASGPPPGVPPAEGWGDFGRGDPISLRSAAPAAMAWAIGCSEACSNAPASRSSSRSSTPGAVKTSWSCMRPVVTVPVLSTVAIRSVTSMPAAHEAQVMPPMESSTSWAGVGAVPAAIVSGAVLGMCVSPGGGRDVRRPYQRSDTSRRGEGFALLGPGAPAG